MNPETDSALSPLVAALNPQQREAVLASDGAVLILAGAGSGKTRVITSRIAHLIRERDIPPWRILAVTFTNKAAAEMRERIEKLLEGTPLTSWVSTFHALCVRLLRREAAAAGLEPGFLIYDDDDQMAAIREAMRDLNLSEKLHPPRRLLSRISATKNLRKQPEGDDDEGASLAERVGARYAHILERAGALDFDDLLIRAVALLQQNEDVCARYRERFQYLLVDEYQDTNRTQYDLVRLLAGGHGNLTVVGDEDQSIYSWRGADIRNILDFEADFPGARVLRLEENYRSTQSILDAASGLVAHNRARKGKVLRATKAGGAPVRLHRAGDEYQEAAFVVDKIAAGRGGGRRAAVLFRTNAQSRQFEEGLLRVGIPYLVVGGVGFYQRKEVRDVLAYLRLIQNPRDHLALRRVLNVPARGIGDRTVAEIERVAAARGSTRWEALGAIVDDALLPARATQPLARFREVIEALRTEAAAGLSLRTLIERTLALSGYSAALAQQDDQESQDRLENLAELLSAAVDYEARESSPTLAGFLDRSSLLADADQVKDDAPVVLMTFHSAKGLEFDSVFLVGMEEGLVPHTRSLQSPAALEEERRLVYVGMTRAMERLFLTWAQSRQVFGQRRLAEPSRFLTEIPRDQVEASGEASAPVWTAPRPRFGRETTAASEPGVPPVPPDLQEMRPGVRVRHPLFGAGTIVRREGTDDDLKLTVSFPGVGAKRLVARYAGLTVE
ncbi:MAG: UvrD-helicase domain-containing protein [Vicinamibacteria bacterium]